MKVHHIISISLLSISLSMAGCVRNPSAGYANNYGNSTSNPSYYNPNGTYAGPTQNVPATTSNSTNNGNNGKRALAVAGALTAGAAVGRWEVAHPFRFLKMIGAIK